MTVVVILSLLTATPAANAPANVADGNAVVVLTPRAASPSDDQLAADVARELQLGGFTVTRVTTSIVDEDGLRAELVNLAREHNAVGGIRLLPTRAQISVEVWAHDQEIRKLRRRDFPAVSADERRVVALRAVELLRAVLLEVSLAAEAPQEPPAATPVQPIVVEAPAPATPPAPVVTRDEVREDTSTARNNVWRAGLGFGGDKLGNAQISPTASLSLGRLVSQAWLLEMGLRAGVLAMNEQEQNAKVATREFSGTLGVGPLWRIAPWELGFLLAGGVSAFVVQGEADAPLIARKATIVRPTATASVRATYWLGEHVWARLAGQLGWVRPLDLYLGNSNVADVGPLTVACELAFGFAWDGSR